MLTDFSTEYSHKTGDELLRLAAERDSLTQEARTALDAELRRRNLTESDRLEYLKFFKQQDRRDRKIQRRKVLGTLSEQRSRRDTMVALVLGGLILCAYLALPSRYQLKPDWENSAAFVLITSTGIVAIMEPRKSIAFWIALAISSALHLFAIHALAHRFPNLDRGTFYGAMLLGMGIFALVYMTIRLFKRNWYGLEASAAGKEE